MNTRGFTLIETILYIALLSLFLTGVITSTYSLLESSHQTQESAILENEGDFLLAKIHWVISNAQSIGAPVQNTTGGILSVVPWDTSRGSPLVVNVTGGNMTITHGSGVPEILNATDVWITDFVFTHTHAQGVGTMPESVSVDFILNAHTAEGKTISEVFSSTYYLRK